MYEGQSEMIQPNLCSEAVTDNDGYFFYQY